MTQIPAEVVDDLVKGKLYSFSDWPNHDLPDVAIGMYTIWQGDLFAYVGISGTSLKSEDFAMKATKKRGLKQRLNSHRKGGLGGDKFCVYVYHQIYSSLLNSIQGTYLFYSYNVDQINYMVLLFQTKYHLSIHIYQHVYILMQNSL